MNFCYKDDYKQTVLITGATDGIGLALAHLYRPQAKNLILIGRRSFEDIPLSDFSSDSYCQVDLVNETCAETIHDFLDKNDIESIDLLIHNAGIGYYGDTAEQTADSIQSLVAVNVWAPISITQRLLPRIRLVHGKIVFISSVTSVLPTPKYAVYGATKAALDAFARNLRIELRASVRVQVIHPGGTRTSMHQKSGLTRAVIDWERFPTAEDVAIKIMKAIEGNKPAVTIGLGNKILRFSGRFLGWLVRTMVQHRDAQTSLSGATNETAKHCVITGAADGIGKALAVHFAQAGYTITGIDIDQQKAEVLQTNLTQQGHDAVFIKTDLTQKAEIVLLTQTLAKRPHIDVLIHNAGINAVGHFAEMDLRRQQNVLHLNFQTPLLLTANLLKQQKFTDSANLVFISSLSYFVSYPGATVYAASKDGLAAYARSLGINMANHPSQVLTVFPGPTRTAHARRYSPDNSREAKRMAPETLAKYIFTAVQKRQRVLIPSLGNKLFALFGKLLPGVAEKIMQRVIFDILPEKESGNKKSLATTKDDFAGF